MKVALLQGNSVPGDVAGNMARIRHAALQAGKAGAALCVTPELALSGVAPGHYLLAADFASGCLSALDRLAEDLKSGPALLVGAPVPSVYATGLLSNAAVLMHAGAWRVVSRKIYRSRGQTCGAAAVDDDAPYFDRGVSCGIVTLHGWRIGVALCECDPDGAAFFWQADRSGGQSPLLELMRRGVDAIAHLAAAPFRDGGQETAEQLLSHVAARHHIHLFSTNLVGGDDSRVYSGQSVFIDPTGQIRGRAKAFAEDTLVVDTAQKDEAASPVSPQPDREESRWHALVLGTRDFVRKCGASKALVALSGGMDSALVACVAVEALGADNVTGVLMPSPYSSPGSVADAKQLAANLGMATVILPIGPLMDACAQTLAPGLDLFPKRPGDTTSENIQARIRGLLVTCLANRAGALVLNTGNKSEGAVGYSTLYGDSVGALAVIGDLTKSAVYAVARWCNAHRGAPIPEAIFTKAPSAELRPNQRDEDSLPPYAALDPVIEHLLQPQPEGWQEGMDELHRETRTRLFGAEFKRRQAPPALFLSRSPFGAGWRIPIAGRYRLPGDR